MTKKSTRASLTMDVTVYMDISHLISDFSLKEGKNNVGNVGIKKQEVTVYFPEFNKIFSNLKKWRK